MEHVTDPRRYVEMIIQFYESTKWKKFKKYRSLLEPGDHSDLDTTDFVVKMTANGTKHLLASYNG